MYKHDSGAVQYYMEPVTIVFENIELTYYFAFSSQYNNI